MLQKIDLATWPRREVFTFFSQMSNPFYMVSFKQEVTNLVKYCKESQLSFYYALIYLTCQTMNEIENFRYFLQEEEVYLYSERIPSFTDLKKGSEQFHIVTMDLKADLRDFCQQAKVQSSQQATFIEPYAEENLIYYSCLPWLDLTALTNERDLANPKVKDDNIPRISWGKYTKNQDKIELVISLEVNHRFVDGLHVGRFAEN
ncbi:chloramphenicol acetyltransferase [Enterococcus cecorum]|uniref:CatA-like O-acetyltransferase n=1 Tax=Enterococcus cecorum TaxID=44008 RepID=UPI000AF1092A|nr:CatA-like O-acetyltransferase [Enterococcus cecorum]CAI3419227.1 chloramphenicol acetyltransferase [Enterococcus cecorum]